LAEAHVLALDALERGVPGTAYNLGNGQGFSVKNVIATASIVTGCKIRKNICPRRDGDPPRLVGDSRKILNELGWKPQYTDLQVIIETAWKWSLKNNKANQV
jgi:UDP-glucose 4-epimerase